MFDGFKNFYMILISRLATTFHRILSQLLVKHQSNESECQCFGHALKS